MFGHDGPAGASSVDLLVMLREHGVVDILMSVDQTAIYVSVGFRPYEFAAEAPDDRVYTNRYYLETPVQYDAWRYLADLASWLLLRGVFYS